MRILELLLNTEEATASYESWCFEPEKEERKLGKLYLVGKLERNDPSLLNDLASVINETYYSSQKDNLREAIKKANQKIKENGIKKGELHFAILIIEKQRLRFTKIGNIKIILLRKKGFLDLGKNLNQPKFFENIASGYLKRGDKLLVLNKELLEEVSKKRLISAILPLFKPKRIKKILESKVSKSSGVCLVIISNLLFLPKLRMPKLKIPSLPRFRIPRLKLPELKIPRIKKPSLKDFKKKKIIIVFLLIALIGIGSFIFQREKQEKAALLRQKVNQIQEKVKRAENLLALKKEKEAETLLEESFKMIIPLTKERIAQKKVISLKKKIKDYLFEINHLEKIKEPDLVFEFNPKQIVPKKIIAYQDKIYAFSPYQENIYLIKNSKKKIIKTATKFKGATIVKDNILFFSDKTLTLYTHNEFKELSLKIPYPDFNFTALSSFKSSFYLLDGKKGEVLKGDLSKKSQLNTWLSDFSKKPTQSSSLSVNGSVWVLKEKSLERYYAGQYQETIKLDLFPKVNHLTKVYTKLNLPYLYLLEPANQRVIILSKQGEVIKQFQSAQFKQLKDFAITNQGRTIYLLSGQKIYRISFSLS